MDLAEALRGEDLAKTDFFDLVVGSDLGTAESHLQLTRTLKSMGLCLVDAPDSVASGENATALLPVDVIKQEANNNTLLLPSANAGNEASDGAEPVDPYWQNACDKETVRIETAILEDLNKYCWNGEGELGAGVPLRPLNTDGAIYTLTVLNGGETLSSENSGNGGSGNGNETGPTTGVASVLDSQTPLDLDSILSIIPGDQTTATVTAAGTLHHSSSGTTTYITESPFETVLIPESKNEYLYEDSGYGGLEASNPEGGTSSSAGGSYISSADNNNDWKQADHNATNLTTATVVAGTADSLLRSALQGKAAFPSQQHRYKRESSESMDEILFPPLDTFPDEYEKLKRIANEVAESVSQYCRDSPNQTLPSGTGVTLFTSLTPAAPQTDPTTVVITTANATATTGISPVRNGKKYKKGSCNKSGSSSVSGTSGNSSNGSATSTGSGGSSSGSSSSVSGNGPRKERSLHYCNICSKGFKDKYSVNVHIRTHTGEKPFSCSLCGKSFRQKAHLAKHYQTHLAQKSSTTGGATKSGGKARYPGGKQQPASATVDA